jgi:hypothetical protein
VASAICASIAIACAETNVSASTGKSTYKCDRYKKLTGDTANEHSVARSSRKPTESQCSASGIGDNDSLRAQLEAVHENGICTMETIQSLVVI